jgi:hypothetical protein
VPLVFYDKAEFTKATSRSNALLCSCAAFAILLLLGQRRPRAVRAGTATT